MKNYQFTTIMAVLFAMWASIMEFIAHFNVLIPYAIMWYFIFVSIYWLYKEEK